MKKPAATWLDAAIFALKIIASVAGLTLIAACCYHIAAAVWRATAWFFGGMH